MLHVRKTTNAVASIDLETYQHKKAEKALQHFTGLLPQFDNSLVDTDTLATNALNTYWTTLNEHKQAQLQKYFDRPNTPFTEKLRKQLLQQNNLPVDTDVKENENNNEDTTKVTTTYNKGVTSPNISSSSPQDKKRTQRRNTIELANTAHLQAHASLPYSHPEHQHGHRRTDMLLDQPAQTGAMRIIQALDKQQDITNRVRALESRIRKQRALQGLPPSAPGFTTPNTAELHKTLDPKGITNTTLGINDITMYHTESLSNTTLGRLALRDYVVDLSSPDHNSNGKLKHKNRSIPSSSFSSSSSSTLFPDPFSTVASSRSEYTNNNDIPIITTTTIPNNEHDGIPTSTPRPDDIFGTSSASRKPNHSSSSASSIGSPTGKNTTDTQPEHSRERDCHSARPQEWVRPWRESMGEGKMHYVYQIYPGRAYEGFGDFTSFSHSFRDREKEKELGSPRISTSVHADPKRAYVLPGEIDLATTALIELENKSRHYRDHPFLYKHNRVIAPTDDYVNNGAVDAHVLDPDIKPIPGEKEKRQQSLGIDHIVLPKNVDPLRVDRPWSAWNTPILPVHSSSPSGGKKAPQLSGETGKQDNRNLLPLLSPIRPQTSNKNSSANMEPTNTVRHITKGTLQQEQYVTRMRTYRGLPKEKTLPEGYGSTPNNTTAFTIDVEKFAKTGIDPLSIATSARNPVINQSLRLNPSALRSTEQYYADPIKPNEFSHSPFRDGKAWMKRMAQSAGRYNKANYTEHTNHTVPTEIINSDLANTGSKLITVTNPVPFQSNEKDITITTTSTTTNKIVVRGPGGSPPHVGTITDGVMQNQKSITLSTALHSFNANPNSPTKKLANHSGKNNGDFVPYSQSAGGWSYRKVF